LACGGDHRARASVGETLVRNAMSAGVRTAIRVAVLAASSLLGAAAGFAQQSAVEFWVIERAPPAGTDLGVSDGLHVRLGYRSDRPVRFQMRGLAQGKQVKAGAMYNVAPPYPAGEGEAIVWLAHRQPVAIDEIAIEAMEADWKPISTLRVAATLGWSTGIAKRQPVEWASRLHQEQQAMASRQIQQHSQSSGSLVLLLLPLGALAYFVLQPLTVWLLDRGWRVAALAPLIATVPLILHAALAFAAGANLWPLLLILFLPFATLYLLGLCGVRMLVRVAA
jgi:hypothetical protein